MLPARTQLSDQLVRLIEIRLLDPLEVLLGDGSSGGGSADGVDALRAKARARAEVWARRILEGDDREAIETIASMISVLYSDDDLFEPPTDWWRSPLGQAVAWRTGHPTSRSVSYAVAGAMLGITRQGVHDLVTRGKLARHPDGGVDPASVRDRIHELEGHIRA